MTVSLGVSLLSLEGEISILRSEWVCWVLGVSEGSFLALSSLIYMARIGNQSTFIVNEHHSHSVSME